MSSTSRPVESSDPNLVVLVDTSDNNSRTLERILSREGFRVTTVKSASDARSILGRERVHAVVSEITLPDATAETFLESALRLCPGARVVFTCTQFEVRRRQRLIERGATACTSLPIDIDELKALLLGRGASRPPRE